MSTRKYQELLKPTLHNVGQINSWKVRDIANGAIVEATPIDNYTIVELGFDADGNRVAKQLSDVTKEQYLIAAVERRYLNEELAEFYNEVGERARIVILDQGVRFETSAFKMNTGKTEIAKGDLVHFSPADKAYVVSDAASPHADYAKASKKFVVVADDEDTAGSYAKPVIRLEVQ